MIKKAGKTRNCIEPWRSVQFDAEGNVTPCCSGTITGNFGNIIAEHFNRIEQGLPSTIFSNPGYRQLRNGLLTGNLHPSCISCRSVHDEDVSPDELRKRVVNHLQSQGVSTEGKDLTALFAFAECGGNITNRCNFSCVYCSHSGDGGHIGYYGKEMEREQFLGIIAFLYGNGLKIFNFCGIGELTIYPDWDGLARAILERCPGIRLRAISNFGKRLSESELDTLSRFDLLHISCDTLDEKLYASLRPGGTLSLLLDNLHRLKERLAANQPEGPMLAFNVTLTDAVVYRLEELFRFAAANDMFVHLSTLFEMKGSKASATRCVKNITEMPLVELPRVREVIYDLPRRMKAENHLANVWEYSFIYNEITQKVSPLTFNQFVPANGDVFYTAFYRDNLRNPHAFLRKYWLSFDVAIKGILILSGAKVTLTLPCRTGELTFRPHWCLERIDGGAELFSGQIEVLSVSDTITVAAPVSARYYSHLLLEVISFEPSDSTIKPIRSELSPHPFFGCSEGIVVRESIFKDERHVIEQLVASHVPLVIWCAGLRTLQLLSNTSLGSANITMIIDGNHARRGEEFCGHTISSPEDIAGFDGKIVIIHSSFPEKVEQQIRLLGIKNEICIL